MRMFASRCIGLLLLGVISGCSNNAADALTAVTPINFYDEPPLAVQQILLAEGEAGAPREVHLFVPQAQGVYPLLQFQHGFTSDVDTYTDLLARVAGFGFVVVAPQVYAGNPSTAPTVPDETAAAVQVLDWAQASLNGVLAAQVLLHAVQISSADTGLFGHSRGGQVAFRMLFDHPEIQARAIAGVDPVDGDAPPFPPGGTGELVTDDPGAFQFPFPSLIIGMGLGSVGIPGFECAPANRNYELFYNTSTPPRYEVVASNYGHADMTNGDVPGGVCFGSVDGTRDQLRSFVAGQLAAYFSSVLKNQNQFQWLKDLSRAPISTVGRFEE